MIHRIGLFPHAGQEFLVDCTVRGETPEMLATAARGYWQIEALHHVRDTTFDENTQRLRAGSSARVIAVVRDAAIATLRPTSSTSAATDRRRPPRTTPIDPSQRSISQSENDRCPGGRAPLNGRTTFGVAIPPVAETAAAMEPAAERRDDSQRPARSGNHDHGRNGARR
jgi:hypothetical protein